LRGAVNLFWTRAKRQGTNKKHALIMFLVQIEEQRVQIHGKKGIRFALLVRKLRGGWGVLTVQTGLKEKTPVRKAKSAEDNKSS